MQDGEGGEAQKAQQAYYNCQVKVWKFQIGDWIIVLVPTAENKLLARWQGSYKVIEGRLTIRFDNLITESRSKSTTSTC